MHDLLPLRVIQVRVLLNQTIHLQRRQLLLAAIATTYFDVPAGTPRSIRNCSAQNARRWASAEFESSSPTAVSVPNHKKVCIRFKLQILLEVGRQGIQSRFLAISKSTCRILFSRVLWREEKRCAVQGDVQEEPVPGKERPTGRVMDLAVAQRC